MGCNAALGAELLEGVVDRTQADQQVGHCEQLVLAQEGGMVGGAELVADPALQDECGAFQRPARAARGPGDAVLGSDDPSCGGFPEEPALVVLTRKVPVLRADGESRSHRDVGQREALERASHQALARLCRGDALGHIQVEHGAAGLLALQFLLPLEGFERIVGEADRKLRRIGVVGPLVRARLQNARTALAVLPGEPVSGPLGRGASRL
jgi:hypothetical protein